MPRVFLRLDLVQLGREGGGLQGLSWLDGWLILSWLGHYVHFGRLCPTFSFTKLEDRVVSMTVVSFNGTNYVHVDNADLELAHGFYHMTIVTIVTWQS